MGGDAFISELRVSHLRSFGQETTLRFRRGLNVIVGANGSGKSNALVRELIPNRAHSTLYVLDILCTQPLF